MLILHLVNASGKPLDPRICQEIAALELWFRTRFPVIQDDAIIADLLEEAARKLAAYEANHGPVQNLRHVAKQAATWVVSTHLRKSDHQVNGKAVHGELLFELMRSTDDGGDVEARLIAEDLLDELPSDRDREIWLLRTVAGFSSQEIAEMENTTPGNVDKIISRTRSRLREFLAGRRSKRADA